MTLKAFSFLYVAVSVQLNGKNAVVINTVPNPFIIKRRRHIKRIHCGSGVTTTITLIYSTQRRG